MNSDFGGEFSGQGAQANPGEACGPVRSIRPHGTGMRSLRQVACLTRVFAFARGRMPLHPAAMPDAATRDTVILDVPNQPIRKPPRRLIQHALLGMWQPRPVVCGPFS
jgi:hypothetical protein